LEILASDSGGAIAPLAAWGEFIGGIAVVVSLIYLAGQIRSNSKTVRASNFSSDVDAIQNFFSLIIDPRGGPRRDPGWRRRGGRPRREGNRRGASVTVLSKTTVSDEVELDFRRCAGCGIPGEP